MEITWESTVNFIVTSLAVFAAWQAKRSADASKEAIKGQIVQTAMIEYSQPQMASDLRTLKDWEKTHKGDFATEWLKQLNDNKPQAFEVEDARRRVKYYFIRAVNMRLTNFIDDKTFKLISYVHGINIFYDIVFPLELKLNPSASTKEKEYLEKIVGRYEQGTPKR